MVQDFDDREQYSEQVVVLLVVLYMLGGGFGRDFRPPSFTVDYDMASVRWSFFNDLHTSV